WSDFRYMSRALTRSSVTRPGTCSCAFRLRGDVVSPGFGSVSDDGSDTTPAGQLNVNSCRSENPGNSARRYRTPTISHRLCRSITLPFWSTGSAFSMNDPG